MLLAKEVFGGDLSGHGKPRTLVLAYTRSFTRFVHACVELETVNTAFSFGRVILWTGHCTFIRFGLSLVLGPTVPGLLSAPHCRRILRLFG